MFIRGLFLLNNDYLLQCIIGGIILAAIVFYLYDRVCRFNKIYTIIGICYLSIIIIMVLCSVGVYITNQTIKNLVFMIGAILFVSSDMILILYNFSKKDKWMHPVYSVFSFKYLFLFSFWCFFFNNFFLRRFFWLHKIFIKLRFFLNNLRRLFFLI